MNKESLCKLLLTLTFCGIAPACTSPGTLDADDALAESDRGSLSAPSNGGAQLTQNAAQTRGEGLGDATSGLVHKTPKVPVVIDGVQYAPEGIHRFDGRPLYMLVDLAEPDVLVGFTKQSDFRAAVNVKQATRSSSITSQFVAGQSTDYYSNDDCTGDKLTVNSGWGINDLRAVRRGCNIFGSCVGDWNHVISSFWVNGSQTLNTDFQYGGGWFWVSGWGCVNLAPYGWWRIASSLNVW